MTSTDQKGRVKRLKVEGFTGMYRTIIGIPPAIPHEVASQGARNAAKERKLGLDTWKDKFQYPRVLLGLPPHVSALDKNDRSMEYWNEWRGELSKELVAFGAYVSNTRPLASGLVTNAESESIRDFLEILEFHYKALALHDFGDSDMASLLSAFHYASLLHLLLEVRDGEYFWKAGLLKKGGLMAFRRVLEEFRDPVPYLRYVSSQDASISVDDEVNNLSLSDTGYSISIFNLITDLVDLSSKLKGKDARLTFGWDATRGVIVVQSKGKRIFRQIMNDRNLSELLRAEHPDWWMEEDRLIIPPAPQHTYRAWEFMMLKLREKVDVLMPLAKRIAEGSKLEAHEYKRLTEISHWIVSLERDESWSREFFERASFNVLWKALKGKSLDEGEDRALRITLDWMANKIQRARSGSKRVDRIWRDEFGAHISLHSLKKVAETDEPIDDELMQGLKWSAERALRSKGVLRQLFDRAKLEDTPEGHVVRGFIERNQNTLTWFYTFAEAVIDYAKQGKLNNEWKGDASDWLRQRAAKAIRSGYARCWNPLERLQMGSFGPTLDVTVDLPEDKIEIANWADVNAVMDRIILCAAYLPGKTALKVSFDTTENHIVIENEDGGLVRFLSEMMDTTNVHLRPRLVDEMMTYSTIRSDTVRRAESTLNVDSSANEIRLPVLIGSHMLGGTHKRRDSGWLIPSITRFFSSGARARSL